MLGPLFLSLALTLTGTVETISPAGWGIWRNTWWAVHWAHSGVSQTIGAGLGMGLLAGTYMLSLAAGFAIILTQYLPTEFGVMFWLCRRRLGDELIALSLNFNPIVVAIHHLVRITLTIFCGKLLENTSDDLQPWLIKGLVSPT